MNVANFNKDVKKIKGDSDTYIALKNNGIIVACIDENDYDDIYAESTQPRGMAEISLFDGMVTLWANEYEIKRSLEVNENV